MKRIRQGWNTLRRNKRSGVSLIVALCAVAVLIGLSLSIVYSSSMLLSRANRKIGRERCYQLAKSFAEVLDSELMAYNTDNPNFQADDARHPPSGDGTKTFYEWANQVLEKYQEYNADDEESTYYYTVGSKDDDYGKVTVMLRNIPVDNPTKPETIHNKFSYDEKDSETTIIEHYVSLQYHLWVGVKVEKGADSFTYTTDYYRRDGYKPIYTWEGQLQTLTPVYWISPYFCGSNNIDAKLEPAKDENGEVEEVHISYRYNMDFPTYKIYEPIHPTTTQQSEVQSDE